MKSSFRNQLRNSKFGSWNHALTRTTTGYTADGWKMTLTGGGGTPPTVTIGQGTNDASISTPLWYRGKPNLQVDITDLGGPNANVQVRQLLEFGQEATTEHHAFSMLCCGPAGATFQAGVNGQYTTVTTKGQRYTDDFGYVYIPTEVRFAFPLNTVSGTISCDLMNKPTATGTYQFLIAQEETLHEDFLVSPWEFLTPEVERAMLDRYAWLTTGGKTGQANAAGTGLCLGLDFPVEMRDAPAYTAKLSAIGALSITELTTGTVKVSTGVTTHAATDITTHGARLALTGGWAGLTAGGLYKLNTHGVGLFSAEY